jgi:hypothetical protein
MKPAILLFLSITLITTEMRAQYRKSIQVKAGEDIAQAFSPNGFYRFANFANGTLFAPNRSGNSAHLYNYNMLSGTMQFINGRGDTMDMTNPGLFDSILINNTVFFYKGQDGFVEVLATAYPVRLVKKVTIKMKPVTIGAYDGASTTSAIKRISQYTIVTTTVYNLTISDDVMLKESVDWFWMGENGELVKASKKNLMTMLSPELQARALGIIKDKKIEFDRERDLIQLINSLH